jgi:3-oxoacyl-[acyl-carrier-protein] synthase-3
VATSVLKTGAAKNILLIGTERLSSVVDWRDRNTCVLFGDGAGAVVVRHEPGQPGPAGYRLGSRSALPRIAPPRKIPLPGARRSRRPPRRAGLHRHGRKEIFKQAVTAMADSSRRAMEKAGVKLEDIACVISHQANIRIIDALVEKLEVPAGALLRQRPALRQHVGGLHPGIALRTRPARR